MQQITQDNIRQVIEQFKLLQDQLCHSLESFEDQPFKEDCWQHASGGGGRTRVIENGKVIEKGGVNFSHVLGAALPSAASEKRPEIAGQPFEAAGISTVIHPRNPYVPTAHMNIRIFSAGSEDENKTWWFGGGFDLTPYYGFNEDAVNWHKKAKEICDRLGDTRYDEYKKWCDKYFYIRHRNEARGIGGIFFDDLNDKSFTECFDFAQSVLKGFGEAYSSIISSRKDMPFAERQKQFQRYRRGRYVEFNLIYDRGTLFGLQSNGRTESILMSMPPEVNWVYDFKPTTGSEESKLYEDFLPIRDWLEIE